MSRHQKRVTVPVSWPIARKTHVWVAKTSPGPHSSADSMPLVIVIRDLLKLVDNAREAKRILYEGKVLVDGKAQTDYKLPVGIFDVITLPLLDQQYRMLKDEKGMFYLSLLESGVARKLARVENKTIINGKKLHTIAAAPTRSSDTCGNSLRGWTRENTAKKLPSRAAANGMRE